MPAMVASPEDELATMYRNAVGQHLGRRDFSAEELAALDYQVVARLPKVGAQGLRIIRAWLHGRGLDLRNAPPGVDDAPRPGVARAVRLLERSGYRVIPPDRDDPAGIPLP